MKLKLAGFSVLAFIVYASMMNDGWWATALPLATVIFPTQVTTTNPASLSQQAIEAKAIAHARSVGLQGDPISVKSKLMTMNEFSIRLNPRNLATDSTTAVWLVVIEGKVSFIEGAPNRFVTPGMPTQTYNAMWEMLDSSNQVMAWGSLKNAKDIDLDRPPVEVYPVTPQVSTNK